MIINEYSTCACIVVVGVLDAVDSQGVYLSSGRLDEERVLGESLHLEAEESLEVELAAERVAVEFVEQRRQLLFLAHRVAQTIARVVLVATKRGARLLEPIARLARKLHEKQTS